MVSPSVNVIIPAYNAEATILRAIASVLKIDMEGLRVIVIDDCSTDGTYEICKNIDDNRLIYLSNDLNLGVAYSRNRGLKFEAEYVAFLDADDFWYGEKLYQQLKILNDSSSTTLGCYSNLVINGLKIRAAPLSVNFKSLVNNGNDIGLSSAIVKRSAIGSLLFDKIGHEDYKFWLDLLAGGGSLLCSSHSDNIDQMTFYEQSGKSLSANKFVAATWTFTILNSVLPLHHAIYFFLKYVFKHVKRLIT